MTDSAEAVFPRPGALPYLTVKGAGEALAWYVKVFGARLRGEPIMMDDGRIGHAELSLGDGEAAGLVYLADEFPEMGLLAPLSGVASVSLVIPVADTDDVLNHASQAGGHVERWTYESHGQRNATMVDPFGHRWLLVAPLGNSTRQGDVTSLVLQVPDVLKAVVFYGAVLGWDCAPDGGVRGTSRPITIEGGHQLVELVCQHAVTDLEAAIGRVADAGGQVVDSSLGQARCVDNQGFAFALVAADGGDPRPPLNGQVAGDPAYLTYEAGSPEQLRDFYGAVLGWQFTGDEGGLEADGVHPMVGVAEVATGLVVPMWRVADVRAAAEQVVALGGEVLAGPEERPFGISAHCRDNQGGRFYLGS